MPPSSRMKGKDSVCSIFRSLKISFTIVGLKWKEGGTGVPEVQGISPTLNSRKQDACCSLLSPVQLLSPLLYWEVRMTFSLSYLLVGLFSSFFLDILATSGTSDSCFEGFALFVFRVAPASSPLLSSFLFLLPWHDVGRGLDTTWVSHTFLKSTSSFQTCSSSGLSCFVYTSLLPPSFRH